MLLSAMQFVLILSIVLQWTHVTVCGQQTLKCFENSVNRKRALMGTPISDFTVKSKLHCSVLCGEYIETIGCFSFLYNEFTKRCKLFSGDYVYPTFGDIDPGWKYYYAFRDCHVTEDSCPSGYYFNQSICFCYKLYNQAINFNTAVTTCSADGAEIAKITRYLRQVEVERILGKSSANSMWIQGQRITGADTWTFTDGSPLSFFHWNTNGGQPQLRDDGENYIVVRKPSSYKWHDVYVGENHPCLCEYSG